MIYPTVGLEGGTSKPALIAGHMLAADAVARAIMHLTEIEPKQWDYDADEWIQAIQEHEHRLLRLHQVLWELRSISASIQEQGTTR